MRRNKDVYRYLIISLILGVILGFIGLYLWNKPLGPSLELPTRTSAEQTAPSRP